MKYNILIADDSPAYQKVIEEIFRLVSNEYNLIFANDGKTACDLAFKYLPDLILMDVIMPEMNGIQAIKLLRSKAATQDIPIIVLSATESLQSVYEAGANDFISKPFKHYELLIKTRSALNLVDKIKRIEKQNQELERKNTKVTLQKEILESQKKDIEDDIRYSKRIQNAILPFKETIDQILREYFILNMPKMLVSGDFYWVGKRDNKAIVAVADCTGHGVSGAFVTMAGIAFLNEIVNKYEFKHASDILFQLRERVMKLLQQKGESGEAWDGMDIALCLIDCDTCEMEYAGANNPVYIISNSELQIYKADRMPIGIHAWFDKPFNHQHISLEEGDVVYLFSDGYPDQFGGPKDKKFRYKQFQQLLLKIHQEPMDKQKETLISTMEAWKGNREQIDDMMILGFRVAKKEC